MRVLHVTECLAGGVLTALEGYVKATPEFEHYVLANSRRGHNLVMRNVQGSTALLELPQQHLAAIRTVRNTVGKVQPDVIHAHSSFAGAYSRLATVRSRIPVVYTPHALAYGRPDFSTKKRIAFKAAEWLLSKNTQVFAGCSIHESNLLRDLNNKVPVITIPNALPPDHPALHVKWQSGPQPTVGMVGRINEYRDPQRFLDIARRIRQQRSDVRFVWIGDGDDAQRELLETNGITVTGWLSSMALQRKIAELSVLLYTSKWDGFPMVILEAITSHVPTLVTNIAPLRECPDPARFSTTEEAARKVLEQLAENKPLAGYWDPLLQAHTFENQKQALIHAYELATAE